MFKQHSDELYDILFKIEILAYHILTTLLLDVLSYQTFELALFVIHM